jgi:nucleoside-diphosphate-sugar epimerase
VSARRVAVTGATGFIGTHVTRHLASVGVDVRPMGRDRSMWPELLRGAEAVVHLAGFAHGRRRPSVDPVAINVELTHSVFEAAAAARVQRFVNMSSIGALVARSKEIVNDSTPPGDVSIYGMSKRESERCLAGATAGPRVVNLRPPAVYGPGMRGKSAMLFTLIERGIPLPIGGIHNRHSFMFVGNLAAAISMILDSPHMTGTFVVSDSPPISTGDFARRIGEALGRPARLFLFPWVGKELRASLPIDSSRFWKTVGGEPPYSMADGLRITATARGTARDAS